ncbi:unnamed protein product [Absidia cylindrospora]
MPIDDCGIDSLRELAWISFENFGTTLHNYHAPTTSCGHQIKEIIGECELYTRSFELLVSYYDRPMCNVMKPGRCVISKLHQRDFGSSLGFGEMCAVH